MYPDTSWESEGREGDLNDQTFNPEGLLKLLHQQKDSHQHVQGWQNFKGFFHSSLLSCIVGFFYNELELLIES